MEAITLKEYFRIKGYGKGQCDMNISKFAELCGVSVAYISKLYNGRPISDKYTDGCNKVSFVMRNDGYTLLKSDDLTALYNDQVKKIEKLQKDITSLKEERDYYKNLASKLSEDVALLNNIKREIMKIKEL